MPDNTEYDVLVALDISLGAGRTDGFLMATMTDEK